MAAFLETYGRTGVMRRAAAAAGISVQTVHNWRRQYKTFARDLEGIRFELRSIAEDAIVQATLDGDWRAAAKMLEYLDRQAPRRAESIPGGAGGKSQARVRQQVTEVNAQVEAILKDAGGKNSASAVPTAAEID